MANPAAISFANYGRETTFATKASTIDKTFGHGVTISNLERKNNIERIFGLGTRNAEELKELGYEGAISTEFTLANPWFWQSVLGSVNTTGSGPYTHTYSEANTIPSMTIINQVETDTKSVADILGAVITTCNLSVAVDSTVKVSCEMPFANEDFDTTNETQVSETYDSFCYAEATLELPNGTTLAYIQNAELQIDNYVVPVKGLGSRFIQAMPVTKREYTINGAAKFSESNDALEVLYGASSGPASSITETANLQLTITNGLSGTSERSQTATVTGIKLDTHNLPQSPLEVIQENWTTFGRSTQVVAVNNTSSAA